MEYKPSFYTAKDDTGKKSKTIVTEEEVTLKTGIMTFDGTSSNTFATPPELQKTRQKNAAL